MTIKILLVCESPEENKRKMWAAEYDGSIYEGGKRYVVTKWGRIGNGYDKNAGMLLSQGFHGKQAQEVPDDNAALNFIDKKVKEKAAKGYQTVLYEHDGLPITFLCDNPPDAYGKIRMKTWGGQN